MPNKTEVKGLHAPELRTLLSEYFEGITEDTTKEQLLEVVDENWEYLDAELNPPEPAKTADQVKEDLEGPQPDWTEDRDAFLRKDLYTGNPPL